MYQLINEINTRLEPFGLKPTEGVHRMHLNPRDKNNLLKVCIAGAFYPNYSLRASCIAREDRERDIFRDMNGRDPSNTIYYRGIGHDEMGILYQNQVKDFLRDKSVIISPEDVTISFDKGANKMFVTFLDKQHVIDSTVNNEKPINDLVPGRICTQVYKALKLEREKNFLKLNVMDKQDMFRFAQNVGAGRYENGVFIPSNINIKHDDLCCLPDRFTKTILGQVSFVITPNKFWIKPSETKNDFIMTAIRQSLNNIRLQRLTDFSHLRGKLVAVGFPSPEEAHKRNIRQQFHRARVLSSTFIDGSHQFKVNLIDEGEDTVVDSLQMHSLDSLWILGRRLGLRDDNEIYVIDIPPRVYEATLAEIRPSYVTSAAGKWTTEAIAKFKELISEQDEHEIEIYSTWNGVASVIIYDKHKSSINKKLLREQLAQTSEESYPSKQDHALRFYAQNFLKKENEVDANSPPSQEVLDYLKEFYMNYYKPPPVDLCTKSITLRGPKSPLETKVYAAFRSAEKKNVGIDRQSVNSILLDTDPQDCTDRLVVAASIASR